MGKKGWNYDNVIETDLSLTVSDFKTKANPTNKNQLIVTRITDSQGNNTSASTNTTSTDNSEATKTTTASKPKSTNRTTRKSKSQIELLAPIKQKLKH